jgi:hypothetical protein
MFIEISNDEKIEELLDTVGESYPDKFIDEIIARNNHTFALDLLRKFNFNSRDYSGDSLLRCFFLSHKPFHQLCSLFLNQIQVTNHYCDTIFGSLFEYTDALLTKATTDLKNTIKNLVLPTLLLCLNSINPDSLTKFLSYSGTIFSNYDIIQMAIFWDNANQETKTQNLLLKYLGIENEESEDEREIYFTKVSIFSKTSQKMFLYVFFLVSPELVNPVIKFI